MDDFAQFQVFLPGQPAASDVLGLWQAQPGADVAESAGVLWRAELPASEEDAAFAIQQHSREIQQTRLALVAAPSRMAVDLSRLARMSEQPEAVDQVAFGVANAAGRSTNVLERAWLYRIDAASFGDAVDPSEVESSTGVISAFCSQVQGLVGQMALVETTQAGWRQAITRVAWNGNVDTWLPATAWQNQPTSHNDVLGQALATRQAWLRFLLLFSAGVVRVAAALTIPTFLPLTLWTTWKYLQQIVGEYRQLRMPTSPP